MTILTRRSPVLPWSFPYNARELKPGQWLLMTEETETGIKTYTLKALDERTAAVSVEESPLTKTGLELVASVKPIIEDQEINRFGPANKNWAFVEGKKNKER